MAKNVLCVKSPSQNVKIAEKGSKLMYATYRPVTRTVVDNKAIDGTCPSECKLLTICYANSGMVGIQQGNAKLREDNVTDWIKELPENGIVRHLVSGDLFSNDKVDTDYIGETQAGHNARPDVRGYGYTHGWVRLDADKLNALSNLNFNASCDTHEDIEKATDAGWDAVTVVGQDVPNVTYFDKFKQVVCPNQTADLTCEKCMLCARKDRKDHRGLPVVVAFKAHGSMKKRVENAFEKSEVE